MLLQLYTSQFYYYYFMDECGYFYYLLYILLKQHNLLLFLKNDEGKRLVSETNVHIVHEAASAQEEKDGKADTI